jgi:hypothetical protein
MPPWEKYQTPASGKPWVKYATPKRGHDAPEYVPPGVPGYDASSGMVDSSVRPPRDSLLDKAGAFVSGAVKGIPIAGPFLDALDRAAAAGMVASFSDQSFGDIYDQMGASSAQVQEDNPYTSTAGHVTGAVAGTLPAMLAAPAAFGIGAGGIVARTVASALTGGGIGGTDAAVRSGGDPDQSFNGLLKGLAAGAAGPAIGAGAGAAYRAAAGWFARRGVHSITDFAPADIQRVMRAAEADGLDPAAIRQRLADLGDDAMIADLGPNLRHQAAGIASLPGPGKETVRSAVTARDAAANARIRGHIDDTLGPAPVPGEIDAAIRTRQTALSPHYQEVLRNAQPADTRAIARFLDTEAQNLRGDAQRAVQTIRRMLNRTGTEELETNPAVLLQVRQAIDDMTETTVGNNALNALSTARQAVDDQLRVSVPGIKRVDALFEELARQREALSRGQQVLESGRTAPRPSELQAQFTDGAVPRGELVGPSAVPMRLREGARAEIERIIGTNANDRVALQRLIKGEGDWNRARLATLFGQDRADKIIRVLDAERTFADTSHVVVRNSETAARQAAQRELTGEPGGFGVVDSYKAGGLPGAARATAFSGVDKIVKALQEAGRTKELGQMASVLVSPQAQQVVDAMVRMGIFSGGTPAVRHIAQALLLGPAVTSTRP